MTTGRESRTTLDATFTWVRDKLRAGFIAHYTLMGILSGTMRVSAVEEDRDGRRRLTVG